MVGGGLALKRGPYPDHLMPKTSDFISQNSVSSLVVLPYKIGRLPDDRTLDTDKILEVPQHTYVRLQDGLMWLRLVVNVIGSALNTVGHPSRDSL